MEFVNVVAAAAGCWILGAVWYGVLANPWMDAVGIKKGPDGKPEDGQNPLMYLGSFLLILIVVGMMRHVFALSGITDMAKGLLSGAGIGAFFIAPWIALNNMYGMRPVKLTMIDAGYAILGTAVAGLILTAF